MIRGLTAFVHLPCALIALAGMARMAPAETRKVSRESGTAPIAVVELFTSEKCPNCPAADAYLGDLAASARRNGEQIYPLAFHVDYWSPPGREDPQKENREVPKDPKVDMLMDVDWVRFSRPKPQVDWAWQSQVREHPLADPNLAEAAILKALGA